MRERIDHHMRSGHARIESVYTGFTMHWLMPRNNRFHSAICNRAISHTIERQRLLEEDKSALWRL